VTLIELLVAMGILAILLTLAIGGWRALQKRNLVEGTIEEIKSAVNLARIRAQATVRDQLVYVDFANDRYCTTAWQGADCVTTGWRKKAGVDLLAATSRCAPSQKTGVRIYRFTPRGTVQKDPTDTGGAGWSVMARTIDGKKFACLVVTNITGRTRIVRP